MTERRYRQAVEAGESARRAGRPRKSPLYGPGPDGQRLRDAWNVGWDRVDERRKKTA